MIKYPFGPVFTGLAIAPLFLGIGIWIGTRLGQASPGLSTEPTEEASANRLSQTNSPAPERPVASYPSQADRPEPSGLPPQENLASSEGFNPNDIATWLPQLSAANAPQIHRLLSELPDSPEKNKALIQLFEKWGAVDGEAAFIAAHDSDSQNSQQNIAAAAAGWAQYAPNQAWGTLMEASNHGAIRKIPLAPALKEIASNDLSLAMRLLQGISNESSQSIAAKPILELASSIYGFEYALAKAQELEDASLRGSLVQSLFETWSQTDLETSLEKLSGWDDPSLAKRSMKGVLQGWAANDGKSAFDYAAAQSSDPLFSDSLASVAKIWLQGASAFEAESIMADIAALSERDELISSLIGDLTAANPQSAIRLTESIENPMARNAAQYRAISQWTRNDLPAAQSYIFSNLDESNQATHMPRLMIDALKRGDPIDSITRQIASMENERDRIVSLRGLKQPVLLQQLTSDQRVAIGQVANQFESELSNIQIMPSGGIKIRVPSSRQRMRRN